MDLRAKGVHGLVVGLVCLGAGGVLPPRRAVGQAQAASAGSMVFEVVSIKPNLTGRSGNMGMIRDGYQAEGISLLQWVVNAYGLRRDYQVLGLPEWAKSAHYDVAAKVGGSDVAAFQKLYYPQMYRMFQPVLEDRFGLRFHWEKRVLPTYTLTLAKKGSALKDGTDRDSKMVHIEGSDAYIGAGTIFTGTDGRLISRAAPMRMLVDVLEGEVNKIVVDETGLKGTYDYELHLPRAPEGTASAAGGIGSAEPMQPGDSVAGSLYEIGLRLVPSKTEQPVLVVDGIQQPSPN
jgi:uncharacterized protein (TIGR03435 family)